MKIAKISGRQGLEGRVDRINRERKFLGSETVLCDTTEMDIYYYTYQNLKMYNPRVNLSVNYVL